MTDYKNEIQVLVSKFETELKNEIINNYFNHVIVDVNKFRSVALNKVNSLRGTWSGGHSVTNLLEQAEANVWLELATNIEMYL